MCFALFGSQSVEGAEGSVEVAGGQIEFNRHVRSILSENCFTCHGPDEKARKGGLRLDVRSEALASHKGRRAIVPGDSAGSELIKRITHLDPEERMPPVDSKYRLSEGEREILSRWIQEGAKYQIQWVYIPPKRPAIPAVGNKNQSGNAIDPFILEKLKTKGLEAAEPADPVTLIRRISFDLIGLPPTVEQVDAFVKDHSPKAYEKLVDRLLASEHYGERMTMHWLDLVRYADTVGYHGDQNISVSPYRDYVIKAFNENMPYDRFTVEQLAGDLLKDATIDQKVASGYNRLNMMTREGGAQDKEYRAKYAADRVRTTSSVWLGVTMGCAECHDHKFDPFTMKDFYSFEAFFADVKGLGAWDAPGTSNTSGDWGTFVSVPTREQRDRLSVIDSATVSLQKKLNESTDELLADQAGWEQGTLEKILHAGPQKVEDFAWID
ncbi:MAG: DUF1549 domain-containing protein, partial [Planctomycetes bacterium]|nr:DUF1549 domain-containing protein [Planctomycetota bacterium]